MTWVKKRSQAVLQAGGHRFDPGHVHQSFLTLRHVQHSCIGRVSTQMSTLPVVSCRDNDTGLDCCSPHTWRARRLTPSSSPRTEPTDTNEVIEPSDCSQDSGQPPPGPQRERLRPGGFFIASTGTLGEQPVRAVRAASRNAHAVGAEEERTRTRDDPGKGWESQIPAGAKGVPSSPRKISCGC